MKLFRVIAAVLVAGLLGGAVRPVDVASARAPAIAAGSTAMDDAAAAAIRSSLTSDAHHSTAPAVAVTEMLSSSRIGMVSTAAAARAATNGIAKENQR